MIGDDREALAEGRVHRVNDIKRLRRRRAVVNRVEVYEWRADRRDDARAVDQLHADGVGAGPMSVLKYSPEMSRRTIPLFNYVRNESSLPQKVRELAMLTTARATDCPYIWNAHVALGRQARASGR